MCDPASAVAAIAALVGTAVSVDAQNEAADRQQQILNAAGEQKERRDDQQNQILLNDAQKYDPTARKQSIDDTAGKIEQGLGQAIAQANSAAPTADSAVTGRVSEEYVKSRADAVGKQTERAAELARLMSRVRAPGDMMQAEATSYGDALTRVGGIATKNRGEFSTAQLNAGAVQPNGGQLLLGDAVRAGGTLYASNAYKNPGGSGMFSNRNPYEVS